MMFRDKKYKFTKLELEEAIYSALIWASDGLAFHVGDDVENSKPLVMGDPDNLTIILVEALTAGLPSGEDSSTSTTS